MNGVRIGVVGKLFRRVETQLRISKVTQTALDEIKAFCQQDGTSSVPAARVKRTLTILPMILRQQWESPDSHELQVAIVCEISFDSSDAADWTDLWLAIEEAVYPPDQAERLAFHQELRESFNCTTGEARFDAPRPTRPLAEMAAAKRFVLVGQIIYDVRKQLNT